MSVVGRRSSDESSDKKKNRDFLFKSKPKTEDEQGKKNAAKDDPKKGKSKIRGKKRELTVFLT